MTNIEYQAPSHDTEHPEETERKRINAQVLRISKRLVERAKAMPQVIESTNTPENNIHVGEVTVTQLRETGDGISVRTNLNSRPSFETAELLKKSATSADRHSQKEVFIGTHGAGVSAYDPHEGSIWTNENVEHSDLTNEETIHVAAGILSKFRGELSKRSIDHTQQSKSAHDDIIDA